jgi:hypothetical protein
MLVKRFHNKIFTSIFLFSFLVLIVPIYSQTCDSCPDQTCPINCGETLTDLSTGTQHYFNFNLTSTEDVSIVMTPSSGVNYNLYARWLENDCPSIYTWNCRPLTEQETCSATLDAGTYYFMVRYDSGSGSYDISLYCGSTPTTTTSSTTTTTSGGGTTTTTGGGTTTTTEGGTTTTTTSTTTSTLISLICDKSEIYVKQKNECNVTGCDKGYWLVSNFNKEPLENEFVEDIPPNEIEFGPTKETGKVFTSVICLEPYVTRNFTTEVIKGPIIICPDSCQVDEDCECEVNECKDGLFLLDNYENEPLESDVVDDLEDTSFTHTFQAQEQGIVRARLVCHDPYETIQEIKVNISQPVTTTTLPNELELKDLTCNETRCELKVNKNTMNEDTKIFVQVIREPQGTIYYSGDLNIDSEDLGTKKAILSELKSCPSGTKLKVLTLAYPESNLNRRLYRIKREAFTC